ncbi:hypothetical protein [Amycolatopsis sp. H20-H5]|uniref:hypothetical protein n=1 Tax=Amycolatopsis sp. H20-H5 TaxID=3046309 RepID=UPI002DB5D171|nr:hypothetical protein [Amycolatopsis sp. H20-H5]MEC3978092.1 hypothetical protein [Amycolatopsis sp. H20-H5]
MITQVDEALCRLIAPYLPAGTVIRLDPPKPTWQTEAQVSSVDLFLFALHDAGAPAGVVRGGKRCALSYLVTARSDTVRGEHALLDGSLRALLETEQLRTELAEECLPIGLSIGDLDPTGLWASLGMPARAAFVVTVTAGLSTG